MLIDINYLLILYSSIHRPDADDWTGEHMSRLRYILGRSPRLGMFAWIADTGTHLLFYSAVIDQREEYYRQLEAAGGQRPK
jgi:hypothetical protein